MSKGRKNISGKLKVIRGTNQPVRMNYDEPEYDKITKVSVPRILSTPRAKKIYRERAKVMINMGILQEPDQDLLVAYANTLDLYYQAVEKQSDGTNDLVAELINEKGEKKLVVSPYIKLQKELIDIVSRISSQFGFSPASRSSLKMAPKEEKDPFERFMNK